MGPDAFAACPATVPTRKKKIAGIIFFWNAFRRVPSSLLPPHSGVPHLDFFFGSQPEFSTGVPHLDLFSTGIIQSLGKCLVPRDRGPGEPAFFYIRKRFVVIVVSSWFWLIFFFFFCILLFFFGILLNFLTQFFKSAYLAN